MPVDKFGRSSESERVGSIRVFANNNFLRRDGTNTAKGPIDMNGHKLRNVGYPTTVHDAASKHYVDTVRHKCDIYRAAGNVQSHERTVLHLHPVWPLELTEYSNGSNSITQGIYKFTVVGNCRTTIGRGFDVLLIYSEASSSRRIPIRRYTVTANDFDFTAVIAIGDSSIGIEIHHVDLDHDVDFQIDVLLVIERL